MGFKPRIGDLAALTQAFSAAAINPSLWETAMDAAARVTGSVGSVLLPLEGHLPTVPVSQSIGDLFATFMRDGWYLRDERYRGVPAMMQRGVMSDLDYAHPDEFARSPFYQEYLATFGMRWVVGVKIAAGDDLWCLAIQRSIKQGPLLANDLRRMGVLSRSLASAAALARAIGFARAEAALDAFELSGSAVVLIDRCGEVFRINKSAEHVLISCDLRVINKRLVSWDRVATATLDRALRALIWHEDGSSLTPPIVLPRREGRPILAYPSRLAGVAADCFAPCRLVVVLIDLEARVRPVEQDFMQTFHLTPAEAHLAYQLVSGETIEKAASKLGVATGTSRNQIKSIFQKTDTHRQAQLVTLLARFLPAGRPSGDAPIIPNGT